jgi:hypothetical protein
MNENAGTPQEPNPPLKTCSRCQIPKHQKEFYKSQWNRDGLACQCKKCAQKTNKEYREAHPETVKATSKNYYKNHTKKCRTANRAGHYRRSFNLSLADIETIKAYQNNQCAICGVSLNSRRPNLDHRHTDGLIRGFLCWRCNRALGVYRDRIDWLLNTIIFLLCPPAIEALGHAHFGWAGRVGTKKQRKLAKKNPNPVGTFTYQDPVAVLLKKIQELKGTA